MLFILECVGLVFLMIGLCLLAIVFGDYSVRIVPREKGKNTVNPYSFLKWKAPRYRHYADEAWLNRRRDYTLSDNVVIVSSFNEDYLVTAILAVFFGKGFSAVFFKLLSAFFAVFTVPQMHESIRLGGIVASLIVAAVTVATGVVFYMIRQGTQDAKIRSLAARDVKNKRRPLIKGTPCVVDTFMRAKSIMKTEKVCHAR